MMSLATFETHKQRGNPVARRMTSHEYQAAYETLQQLPTTRDLSPDVKNLLTSSSLSKTYSAGEVIWREGDPGDYFAIICEGFVKLSRHTTNKNETIVGIFGPSDVIGMVAVMGNSRFPNTARALTSKTRILRCNFKLSRQQHLGEQFHTWIRDAILRHELVLRDKIDLLNGQTAEIRLAELLLQLSRRFGKENAPGHSQAPFYLTRAQIGRLVNVRVETVIRILSHWNKTGQVSWTKEGLFVRDIHALKRDLYSKSI